MIASGIPPHLVTAGRLASLEREIATLQKTVTEGLDKNLAKVLESVAELPNKLKDEMLRNFVVDGVTPVSRDDFKALAQSLVDQVKELVQSTTNNAGGAGSLSPEPAVSAAASPTFKTWAWGGKIRHVPPDFRFPRTTLASIVGVWFGGDVERGILPWRQLNRDDFKEAADWNERCRVEATITELQRVARANGVINPTESFGSMDLTAMTNAVHAAYPLLLESIYGVVPKRAGDRQIATVYNKICGKRKLGE